MKSRNSLILYEFHRIPIPRVGGVNFINIDEIVYIKAENTQSDFCLSNQVSHIVANYRFGKLAEFLQAMGFVRIHREYIINLRHLVSIEINSTPLALMSNNRSLPVGPSYLKELKKLLMLNLGSGEPSSEC